MAEGYDAMICDYVDGEAQKCADRIFDLAAKVKNTVKNKNISNQASDNAVRTAIAFFNQPLPVISEDENTENPTSTTEVDLSKNSAFKDELAELRKEILDLKAAQEDSKGLAKMIQKEKSKNKVLRKKLKSLDAKHLLTTRTLEKNLSNVRSFIKRNHKVKRAGDASVAIPSGDSEAATRSASSSDQGVKDMKTTLQLPNSSGAKNVGERAGNPSKQAEESAAVKIPLLPAGVEFPVQKSNTSIEVNLCDPRRKMLKPPGDISTVMMDLAVFSIDRMLVTEIKNESSVLRFCDHNGRDQRSIGERKRKMKLTALSSHRFAYTNGHEIFLITYAKNRKGGYELGGCQKIYVHDTEVEIDALAALSPTTLAASVQTNILMLDTEGKVYRIMEIRAPALSICAPTDDTLVICDSTGVYKRNLYLVKPADKKVLQISSASSVAGYVDGYYFVCDSKKNALYLMGPDSEEVQQVWHLANQLTAGDELLHVSVHFTSNTCACVTKFGFMLIFDMTLTRIEPK